MGAREILVRGLVQFVGLVAVVVGAMGWIAGWGYGHTLVTAGLVVYIATFFNNRISYHRSMGNFYLLDAKGDNELDEVQSAVRQFRKLAAKRPDEAARLARALDRLWRLLNDAGNHQEAVPIAQEAVEIWRALVIDSPGYRGNLSRALNHVGISLGRLHRDDESIPFNEEAIVVQRTLVATEEELLAQHLANLSIDLRNTGRWEQALPPAQEAAGLYRRLVPKDPDLLRIAASNADGLVTILGRLGRSEDAAHAGLEWVGYERARAADHPEREPELAESIRVLGGLLIMADRRDEGEDHWRESLGIRRRLAEASHEHRPAYAEACSTIAHGFEALGEPSEALTLFETGLAIRRDLAAVDPKRHDDLLKDLAQAAFSARLYTDNTEPAAATYAAEALTVARAHPGVLTAETRLWAAERLRQAGFTAEADELSPE